MEDKLKGLYAALLVPFDEHGQVKEEGLKQIAKNAIETEKTRWSIRSCLQILFRAR